MSRFERAESIAYGLGAGFKKSLFQPYLALYKRSKGQPYEGRLRHLLAGPLARGVVAGAAMGGATAVKSILTGQIDYEGFELSRKFVVGIPYFDHKFPRELKTLVINLSSKNRFHCSCSAHSCSRHNTSCERSCKKMS